MIEISLVTLFTVIGVLFLMGMVSMLMFLGTIVGN
jgi:hypothetical protein